MSSTTLRELSAIEQDVQLCREEALAIEDGLRGSGSRRGSRPSSAASNNEGRPLSRVGRQGSQSVGDAIAHIRSRLVGLQDARLDTIALPEGAEGEQARQVRRQLSADISSLSKRLELCQVAVQSHAPLEHVQNQVEGQPLRRQQSSLAPPVLRSQIGTAAAGEAANLASMDGEVLARRPSAVLLDLDLGLGDESAHDDPGRGIAQPTATAQEKDDMVDGMEGGDIVGVQTGEAEGDERAAKKLKGESGYDTTEQPDLVPSDDVAIFSWGRGDLGALLHADNLSHGTGPSDALVLASPNRSGADASNKQRVLGRSMPVAFSCSLYHTAYATPSGEVRSCGQNTDGQVFALESGGGGGEEDTILKPSLVESLLSHRVVRVSCGLTHSAVITDRGLVLTYGGNEFAQLGHSFDYGGGGGGSAVASTRVPPRSVPTLRSSVVVEVACGETFTLALTQNAEVFAWGSRRFCGGGDKLSSLSSLSSSSSSNSSEPEALSSVQMPQLVVALGGVAVHHIDAGPSHCLAMTIDGQALAWGRNQKGQCGVLPVVPLAASSTPPSPSSSASDCSHVWYPQLIVPLDPGLSAARQDDSSPPFFVSAALGDRHSLLVAADGRLYGCGDNRHGQLGRSLIGSSQPASSTSSSSPAGDERVCPAQQLPLPAGASAVAVAAGSSHSLVLTAGGAVLAAGANDCGQCVASHSSGGDEASQSLWQFTPLPTLAGMVDQPKAVLIGAGGSQSFALCRGTVAEAGAGDAAKETSMHAAAHEGTALERLYTLHMPLLGGAHNVDFLPPRVATASAAAAAHEDDTAPVAGGSAGNSQQRQQQQQQQRRRRRHASGHRARLEYMLQQVSGAASAAAAAAAASDAPPSPRHRETHTFTECVARAFGSSAGILSGVALAPFGRNERRPSYEQRGSSSSSNDELRAKLAGWSVSLDAPGLEELYKQILRAASSSIDRAASVTEEEPHKAKHNLNHFVALAALSSGIGTCARELAVTIAAVPDASQPLLTDQYRTALAIWQCPVVTMSNRIGGNGGIVGGDSNAPTSSHEGFILLVRALAGLRGDSRKKLLQAIVAGYADFPELFASRLANPLQTLIAEGIQELQTLTCDPSSGRERPELTLQALTTAGCSSLLADACGAPPPPTAAAPASSKVAHCAEVVRAATVLLQLLTTVNDWFAARRQQHLVPPMKLTVDVVSDLPVLIVNAPPPLPGQQPTFSKGLLFLDLEMFVSGGGRGSHSRVGGFFCRNNFLLRPDTKRELMRVEAQIAQHAAGRSAMQAAVTAMQQQQQEMQQLAMMFGGPMAAVQAAAAAQSRYLILRVERDNLLPMTLNALAAASPAELRRELKVNFLGEEGIDEGGVRKEFFQLLVEQLFSENFGMFVNVNKGSMVAEQLWFSKDCVWSNEEFMLTGMLIGLAVYNGVLLDLHFPSVVYKKLVSTPDSTQPLTLSDVASLDSNLARGLTQLLEHEPASEVEDVFCLTFEVTWESFGVTNQAELIPGGVSIPVTGENRKQYVESYVRWLLEDSVEQQFSAFKRGFDKVVLGDAGANSSQPSRPTALHLLRAEDLEAIVSGTPQLDFQELRSVTTYEGGFDDQHPTVRHFWDVVLEELDIDEQKGLLMFATGSIKAPIGGLAKLPFKIQRSGPDSDNLPTSHTCFNTLLLPEYPTRAKLKRCLSIAIKECEGFGLQ